MALVEINWNPSRRELKHFGLLWTVFFGLVGAYCKWAIQSQSAATVCWIVAAAGLVGYFRPSAWKPVYILWMALALPIGWVVSHLLLLMVYYLIFTPVGLLMRLVGYDPLTRCFDRSSNSYWITHNTSTDVAQYFKQY